MNYSINFPNLGIHLSHVPKNFSIFGFKIALYGVCIAIGMLLAIIVIDYLAKKYDGNSDPYIDLVIYTIIFGVIGARAYYVAFSWDSYKDNPVSVLYLREGGLAIYGGIIVGIITAVIASKIKKLNALRTLDYLMPGVALAQVLGRWGNFFNREAFGEYTDGLFAMELPVSAVRSGEITTLMDIHKHMIDGESFIWVTPNYLYEGMWNICLFLILLFVLKKRVFNGQVFLAYIIGYGSGRCWMESFRTDQLTIGESGLAISQLIGGASAFIAAMVFCVMLSTTIIKRKTGLEGKTEEAISAPNVLNKQEQAVRDDNAAVLAMLRARKTAALEASEEKSLEETAVSKTPMGDGSVKAKKRRKPTERKVEKLGAPEIKK